MTKRAERVRLGYAVGSGEPVEIPIRHMAVAGQTQEAGKTTTLEALIGRAQLRALSFVTKRGESAFQQGRRIAPYFREQADWRFVSSLLEAFLGERMKFERAWIMRATKGARTLADVRRNITGLQDKARGMNADLYLQLAEYLDELIPTIAAVQWAPSVDLQAGVNVMDLEALPTSMQHLVIKSAIDWIAERGEATVVVVPEAWKFIPQGRGTPVKLAALAYIRQGAALGNYLWLDSQDLGGIDKELLRNVPVWLLGVQREANEIKRTLANIPGGVAKPTAADLALLEQGQFFACWGKHTIRTYVQPTWIDAAAGAAIARGERPLVPAPVVPRPRVHKVGAVHVHVPARDFESVEAIGRRFVERGQRAQAAADAAIEGGDTMNEAQEKRLNDKLDTLVGTIGHLVEVLRGRPAAAGVSNGPAPAAAKVGREYSAAESLDNETLYQAFKARLLAEAAADPQILEVLLRRPELRVKVQRHTLTVEGDTLRGRLASLIVEGYFDKARTPGQVQELLRSRGFPAPAPNISKEVGELARMGFLTRDNKWISAVADAKRHVLEEETPARRER